MHVRWSPEAADDLERIHRRIQQDNLAAARHVVQTLYEGCKALKTFPGRGRLGREPGSRELVFTPLPYIAVYRLTGDVLRFRVSGTGHRTGISKGSDPKAGRPFVELL